MNIDKQLQKGSMKVIVLHILSTTPSHGYGIGTKVKKLTEDRLTVTEGTLYPLLHSLEADGYLTSEMQSQGERKKKMYKITDKGLKLLDEKKKEWITFSSVMDRLLASYSLEEI